MKLHGQTLVGLLDDALPGADRSAVVGDGGRVTGVTADSRRVERGMLFVVVRGTREDGACYVVDAVARGAIAIVASQDAEFRRPGVPVIRTGDTRGALALLAATFHGRPSETMTVVGVTGTNGKTTTAHLIEAVLAAAGRGPSAVLGTIQYSWPGTQRPAANTTPGADELPALLAEALEAGCRSAAIEVSSHALDQRRVAAVQFAGAVFTNLSGDHLDYHLSMESYAAAKARLFAHLESGAVVAVNAEDPYAQTMLRDCSARVLRYGLDAPCSPDVTARDVQLSSEGSTFTLVTPQGSAVVNSALLGRYNVLNQLAAATIGVGLGATPQQIAVGLGAVRGVRGRLESVDAGQPFSVLVDYAHTDDAVSNVLRNLRSVVPGRLISVVGCGGDRDRTKRPRMARAAAELSDVAWLTSDNPRSEDPVAIIDDMLSGIYGARNVRVEVDRRQAIAQAISAAQVGDCVAVLGKGHETYQVIGDRRLPFDDREVATRAVESLLRNGAMQESTR